MLLSVHQQQTDDRIEQPLLISDSMRKPDHRSVFFKNYTYFVF